MHEGPCLIMQNMNFRLTSGRYTVFQALADKLLPCETPVSPPNLVPSRSHVMTERLERDAPIERYC